jgi:ferredoxin-NADP reductase
VPLLGRIFSMRRKSAYKEPLAAAHPGAGVRIVGPTGTMSLHDDPDRAIVMIAGGIGITPFISMLRSEAQADRPRPMALLYSNHLYRRHAGHVRGHASDAGRHGHRRR